MFGLGQKHASRVGLKPVKALFSIQIVSVTLPRSTPILDQAVLSVCFERGGKISSTTNTTYDKPAFVREVVVEFGQKVELMATLYKDFKTGRYQEKKGVLILREQTKNNRFGHDTHKGWGRCNVNLHDILNEMGFERTRTKEVSWKFDLLNDSVLKVVITSTIMSSGKDADSMSVASYMTEGSEFSSMAASFSHYDTTAPAAANGNGKGNTSSTKASSTMPSHSNGPDGSDDEDHSPGHREDSDIEESRHSISDHPSSSVKNGAEVPPIQTSPRTYMGYLFGSAEGAAAPVSARSGGAGFRPDQDSIVESPPDKRRNYDLSDSDDAHSQHSDEDEDEEEDRRGEDMKQEQRGKYETRGSPRDNSSSSSAPSSSFQDTRSSSDKGSGLKSSAQGASGKLALQHPQLSGSTTSPATTSSASVKNRFRDLIGRRKSANSAQGKDQDSGQEEDEQSDTGSSSARSAQKSPAMTQYGRSIPSPTEPPAPEDIASPGGNSSMSSKGSPRLDNGDGKAYKKGFFSRVMKPLKPSADRQKEAPAPALKMTGTESSSEPFSPLQPSSANSCTSEASREAFALYDQELRRRGDHVAVLERRLAEQTAQHSAVTAELRQELATTALALRKEKVARAVLTEVTHKGDDRLAAALSEARDEAASAMAECERLRREMRVLSGELQESRDHETRLRRGQDGEMQMMQEAAQVAATNSVLRATAEEENLSLVTSLIETKMQNANMFMEMEEVKRENSHLKKRMQVYAQQVASLEVKYAQSQGRNKKNSYDSD